MKMKTSYLRTRGSSGVGKSNCGSSRGSDCTLAARIARSTKKLLAAGIAIACGKVIHVHRARCTFFLIMLREDLAV